MKNAPAVNSPQDLLAIAVSQNADFEKIEKLMDLHERWEKNESKKAFTEAMTLFKKNPPDIIKDQHVKFKTQKGITEYDHASLANVVKTIGTELSKYGLSAAWKTDQGESGIKVTCTITHIDGHSESTSLTAAPDISGNKNQIQAIGSTVSYLERYTLLALTGLTTKDMDTDGATEPDSEEPINKQQLADIETLKTDAKFSEKDFEFRLNRKFGTKNINNLSKDQGDELLKVLQQAV